MAYGVLPVPGSAYGPCPDACTHIDCGLTREMAAQPCTFCKDHIGYGTPYYQDGTASSVLSKVTGALYPALIHARCYRKREEA